MVKQEQAARRDDAWLQASARASVGAA